MGRRVARCDLVVGRQRGFKVDEFVCDLLWIDEVHILVELGTYGIDTVDVKFGSWLEGY